MNDLATSLLVESEEPERILIVDDDDRNILAMQSLLGDGKRILFTANSGYEALKLLQKQAVDLILLDVQMPGPSGFDTAEMIRARRSQREIPIIFVTAAATSEEFVTKGFASGASDYIVKPVQSDILEQKVKIFLELYRTKRAARQSASLLNQIISNTPVGYVSIGSNGKIYLINPTVEKFFSISKGNLIGKTLEDFEQLLERIGAKSITEKNVAENQGEIVSKIELSKPIRRVIGRIDKTNKNSSSSTLDRLIVLVDVTREAEVDRLKSEFISIAAHELGTPLTSILGYSELLASQKFSQADSKEMFDIIHRQAKLLKNMVSDLLDMSNLESRSIEIENWTAVKLSEVLSDAVNAAVGPNPTERLEVIKVHDKIIHCEKTKLISAITNVLTNALKYSSNEDSVTIQTKLRDKETRKQIGIVVEDHGIGMNPEEVEQVFDRFYRADKSGSVPGTGLGMSLVKEIMDLHDGMVEVVSEKGVGTKVSLWLPVDRPKTAVNIP